MSRVPKRIYCFRVMDSAGGLVDFSDELVEISDALSIGETEIQLFEDVLRIQRFSDSPVGRLYHIARYAPGTQNPTLTPKAAGKVDAEGSLEAPAGKSSRLASAMRWSATTMSFSVDINLHTKSVRAIFSSS